jgi:hypothetical protein
MAYFYPKFNDWDGFVLCKSCYRSTDGRKGTTRCARPQEKSRLRLYDPTLRWDLTSCADARKAELAACKTLAKCHLS